jgi:hypothetical protein
VAWSQGEHAAEQKVIPLDGKGFVMTTQEVLKAPLTLVINWTALLGNKPRS